MSRYTQEQKDQADLRRLQRKPVSEGRRGAVLKYNHSENGKKKHRLYRLALKIIALTHYGKGGKLKCCWRGCQVEDVRMLTLDHLADDGAEKRREGKHPATGTWFYLWVKKQGFPEGFQTLCWNHQWLKRLLKLEKEHHG